jgi:hypothetical protein
MKKLALALAVSVAALSAVPAHADPYGRGRGHHNQGYHHHHRGGNWVAPLIGGALLGGIIANQYYARPQAPYYPPTVYVDPAYPQPIYPNQTICRPVQAIDQYGYPYWTQQCWQQ